MLLSTEVTLDFAKKTLTISVRELVEFGSASHRSFGRTNWWIRLGLGTEIHSRLMEKRRRQITTYQSEVWLERRIPFQDWIIQLQGRADAIYQHESKWIIEEYKTTQTFPSRASARHEMQLLTYSYLWEAANNSMPSPQVVYCAVETEEEKVFPIRYNREELETALQAAIQKVLEAARNGEKARQEKLWAALSLPFPHGTLRAGQETLIKSVEDNLRWRGTLMAQAPTGIGKTAATLFAAVKAGLEQNKRVFFLTSKTLQQEIAVKTLGALNSSGGFKTAQIASKDKMCANDRIICHEDACPYAKDFAIKMERSQITEKFANKNSHFDPREVFNRAKKETVCPFEVQLELANRADVVVADYNYVFEPSAALSLFNNEEEESFLVIDEAHNLADRVREIYSPCLSSACITLAKDELASYPKNTLLLNLLEKFLEVMNAKAREHPMEVPPPLEFAELWPQWERQMLGYFSWKSEQETFSESDALLDFHFAYARWMLVMRSYDSGFSCIAEKSAPGCKISLRCLDPGKVAGKIFSKSAGSVLLSATLAPFSMTANSLGLKDATTLEVPSPFPASKRKILIYPEISTTYQSRPKCYSQVAELIKEVATAHSGRTLVLFPSYEFLKRTLELVGELNVLVQKSGAKHQEQLQLFRDLARLPNGILFGVLGGMYSEGLDYPDNLLSGVIIVSPGLPQISLQRELLRKYYEEACGDGFLYAYLQPGMTKVIQAAGRLIRSEKDRGFILLVCNRFLQSGYAELLPQSWYAEHPGSLISANPAEEIREFFQTSKPAFAQIAE